ncbi:Probable L-type lectin-domain containing receptor kinase VII.2 [Linum perenne]
MPMFALTLTDISYTCDALRMLSPPMTGFPVPSVFLVSIICGVFFSIIGAILVISSPRRFNGNLEKRSIVIFGGTSGIGLAMAQHAAKEGAFVLIIGALFKDLLTAKESILKSTGKTIKVWQAEFSSLIQVKNAMAEAVNPIDILIVAPHAPLDVKDPSDLDEVWHTEMSVLDSLKVIPSMVNAVIPIMERRRSKTPASIAMVSLQYPKSMPYISIGGVEAGIDGMAKLLKKRTELMNINVSLIHSPAVIDEEACKTLPPLPRILTMLTAVKASEAAKKAFMGIHSGKFLIHCGIHGRLKHRNLVSIKGWCKKEKGSLILVYEYMENGSLDRKIFNDDHHSSVLSWEDRMRILRDAARGILYLHEGWEVTVLNRDIKASNALLDKEMNTRLGDFGLAKMHQHGVATSTTMTQVVGTVGYMAPEMVTTGRASTQTDVFSFGVLMLEVICGRRPVEQGKPSFVDMVRKVMDKGDVISVVDSRVKARGGFEDEEVERMVRLALLCTYGDPKVRPTMRQVVKALERGNESQIDNALEANLVDRAGRNNGLWSGYYHHGFNGAEHLTFDHVLQSFPSTNVV